jgi:ParB-like chromosome segregation protein Spo0J
LSAHAQNRNTTFLYGANIMASTLRQAAPTAAIEHLKVADLDPHPRQSELFGNLPDDEFEALVADIKAHNVETPIIVMANRDTVVCGYQRRRAAEQAGLETVPCLVREDLTDSESADVLGLLIRDNIMRRHLRPMQKARLAKQLAALEIERRADEPGDRPQGTELVRDAVGRVLGITGREADRYRNIASTPEPVQQAFNGGLLTVKQAAKVAKLDTKAKKRIARQVKAVMADKSSSRAKKRQLAEIVPKEGPKTERKRKIAEAEPSPLQAVEGLLAAIEPHYEIVIGKMAALLILLANDREEGDHVQIRNRLRAAHRFLGGVLEGIDGILSP